MILWIIDDNNMQNFFSEWYDKSNKIFSDELSNDIEQMNKNIFLSQNIDLNYATMQKNLHMIFGENTNVEKQVCLFDGVLEFLQHVVQVDGADRLFSKHFYDIEWNMFLEADFEKSEMKVYRDHFVHQIRNAYLGYYLIWEIGLYKNIEYAVHKYGSTGFSQYINIYKSKELNSDDRKIFYQKVIMKTWFLSALFHDIGYPLAYHQRYSARMDKYMPYLRVLDNRRQMDFIELSALLSDTYLFKMVDYEELKLKYERFDHGMLSAICLLLNYYHTGAIHRLSNSDRCSIELAAYAIFVHTRNYSIQGNLEKNIRPIFVEDPIAYLLRLCDDLQEWARVYFIVGENSNVLICDKCKKTVEKQENSDIYRCKCGNTFKKITSINYRKINLVEVCKKLTIEDDGKKIIFKLDYDLLKLMEVIKIDEQYAKYRVKELSNLKKLLTDQALLPEIDINYFISNNHMEIKVEIFLRYIEKYFKEKYIKIASKDSNRIKHEFMLENQKEIETSIIRNLHLECDDNIKESLRCEMESIIEYLCNNKQRELICKNPPCENYMENIYLYTLIDGVCQ